MIVFDSLINRIPENHLNAWLWWLSASALLLPTVLGLSALRVSDRIGDLKTEAEAIKTRKAEEQETIAQERLKVSEAELQTTKAKTAELANRLAPRELTAQQRTIFLKFATNVPKGPVEIQSAAGNQEALNYAAAIQDLLTKAGFDVSKDIRMFIATSPRTTSITMKVKTSNPPLHSGVIQEGFEAIGITVPCSVAQPNEEIADDTPIIYVENKP